MTSILWIALGGAVGALLRAGFSVSAVRIAGQHFPYGTLIVNVVGSLLIGFLWAFHEQETFPEPAEAFIFIGLLGAFTTFSTYSLDTVRMIQEGRQFVGLINILLNNLGAIGGAAIGYLLGRVIRGGS